jgi:hypothetical protein
VGKDKPVRVLKTGLTAKKWCERMASITQKIKGA